MKQHKDCNFSYAGLKTQVRLAIESRNMYVANVKRCISAWWILFNLHSLMNSTWLFLLNCKEYYLQVVIFRIRIEDKDSKIKNWSIKILNTSHVLGKHPFVLFEWTITYQKELKKERGKDSYIFVGCVVALSP